MRWWWGLGLALAAPASAQPAPVPPAERRAILDALRHQGDLPDRIFVVRTLRAAGGWAWIVADPQSRDGRQHYETETALLERGPRGWAVVDQPCAEDGCDDRREAARIRRAHPAAPPALFQP